MKQEGIPHFTDTESSQFPLKIVLALVGISFLASTFVFRAMAGRSSEPLAISPRSINLGTVPEGYAPRAVLRISNPYDHVVKIDQVEVSCGCLVVQKPHMIPAKGAVDLAVQYESKFRSGAIRQSISIYADGAKKPQVVAVDGIVRQELVVTPDRVQAPGNFTVTRTDGIPLSANVLSSPTDLIVTSKQKSATQIGYSIALRKSGIAGLHEATLTFGTNHHKLPRIDVPITWRTQGVYRVAPDVVNLGLVALGEKAKQIVLLKGAAIQNLQVRSLPPGLKVTLRKNVSRQEATLFVEWQARVGNASILSERVELSTGNPKEPIIVIPVYAAVQYRGSDCTADLPCRQKG